jgi:hypothetical protein
MPGKLRAFTSDLVVKKLDDASGELAAGVPSFYAKPAAASTLSLSRQARLAAVFATRQWNCLA